MKRILSAVKIAILIACVVFVHDANAQATKQTPVYTYRSTAINPAGASLIAVAAGAVINSGTLTFLYADECTVLADNSLGGSARTLNINFIAPDGTTIIYQQAVTVAIATRAMVVISPSSAGTPPTGVTVIPTKVGPTMAFQLAAAGAAAGSLSWYCR